MKSLLDRLSDPSVWEEFYTYKTSLISTGLFARELRRFINEKRYEPVCRRIIGKEPFPYPKKALISKQSSQKKRTVYTYPYEENMVLKLLTFLLLRKYDGLFCANLYSFRPGKTAKEAVRILMRISKGSAYAYKADIHDYFNSIPMDRFLPLLEKATGDDHALFEFLQGLLVQPNVVYDGKLIEEEKGIMAGTPQSSFFANLYLREMDQYFEDNRIPYARYSDDIILFAKSRKEAEDYRDTILNFLEKKGLSINTDKESFFSLEEGWVFLGFKVRGSEVDIAPSTVRKLKGKMRRKARALRRWQVRNGVLPEKAAAAFIRIFNRKLFESPSNSHDLTWSLWFFPLITTAKSLRVIDDYARDCVRYLLSGSRQKKRFRVSYSEMKKLGMKSLVHEYYLRAAKS